MRSQEPLLGLAGFFCGDFDAFFSGFGEANGDGLLAAFYGAALATFSGF